MASEGAARRAEALCWRDLFALSNAEGQLAEQSRQLESVRSSAGVLLGALSIGISVIAQAMPQVHVSWRGFLGISVLMASLGGLLCILWPRRKWGVGLDPRTISENHRKAPCMDEDVLQSVLTSLSAQIKLNDDQFKWIYNVYRVSIALLWVGTGLAVLQAGEWSK